MQDIEKIIEEAERLKASGDKFSVLAPLRELFGLEEDFSQNTPREKRLVEDLNEWLDKIVAENVLQDSGDDAPDEEDTATDEDAAPLVDANGQGLLFPASEGIPEDFEDEMRKKAKAARAQAEMKKMYADERKKQATMLAKICV